MKAIAKVSSLCLPCCAIFALWGLSACTSTPVAPEPRIAAAPSSEMLSDKHGTPVWHEFVAHPASSGSGQMIEIYWSKPMGRGPFPALLLVHDANVAGGGRYFVDQGLMFNGIQQDWVVAAVSLPGYGKSGLPDKKSKTLQSEKLKNGLELPSLYMRQGLAAAIDALRGKSFVRSQQIAVQGVGFGALVASEVALSTEVTYELLQKENPEALKNLRPEDWPRLGALVLEQGNYPSKRFQLAMLRTEGVKVPTLILDSGDKKLSQAKREKKLRHFLKQYLSPKASLTH